MKRFKQHINEALDAPYKFDSVSGKPGQSSVQYRFTTDFGDKGKVYMQHSLDPDIGTEVVFAINDAMGTTNSNDAFRIFATVAAAIDDYLKKASNVQRLVFSGTKIGDSRNKRVKLYHRLANKLAKKYKMKLKVHDHSTDTDFYLIKEEWVDQTNRLGDVYKNPSSRELKEYGEAADPYGDLAGVLVNNDVYLFSGGGLHDEALELLSKKGLGGKVIKFRGTISKAGKIEELSPSGASSPRSTPAARRKLFNNMMKIYKHKSLNRNMEDIGDVLYPIRVIFGNSKAFNEFQELMDKVKK